MTKPTIFVRQVDSAVGEQSSNIKSEQSATRLQAWLKISDIIKIKDYTHVFKIICSDSDSTTRLLTDGLKVFIYTSYTQPNDPRDLHLQTPSVTTATTDSRHAIQQHFGKQMEDQHL